MLDTDIIKTGQKDMTIEKTLQSLEAMAWLYNCNKLQLELTIVPSEYLNKSQFWMVSRNKCFYYNKNSLMNLKKLPVQTQEII